MFTADDEYFRPNRENLSLPIQMQLSNKPKMLLFYCSFGIYIEFWTFWKINEPNSLSISEIIDS